MKKWNVIQKPAEIVEQRLLEVISGGLFAINNYLSAGRDATSYSQSIPPHKESA